MKLFVSYNHNDGVSSGFGWSLFNYPELPSSSEDIEMIVEKIKASEGLSGGVIPLSFQILPDDSSSSESEET